jgi:hypothetical protein
MLGILLTKWTIRLALACYVAYLAAWLAAPRGAAPRGHAGRWPAVARWLWTVGCGLFLVHVACAFHFYHGWSHAAAWETTASETDAQLGFRFGDGIYFSYVFLGLWVLDVIAAWVWPARSSCPFCLAARPFRAAVHVYMFFIAFNGAIVFEAGPTRWAGLAACLFLAGLAMRAAYNWRSQCGARNSELGATPRLLNPEP